MIKFKEDKVEVSKQMRDGLPTVILPPISVVVGKEPPLVIGDLTREDEGKYNAKCNEIIISSLIKKSQENDSVIRALEAGEVGRISEEQKNQKIEELKIPMVRTRYPYDNEGSEDVVSLDENGKIIVLDSGTE